ncbi:MAG: PAS domain-containing protein [Candidatus Aminicenantales bacterium]
MPLAILDRDFNYIQVSDAYAAACGRPPSDFPGRNHFELYANEQNEKIFRAVVETRRAFMACAKPLPLSELSQVQEGTAARLDWKLSPVTDETGDVSHLILSGTGQPDGHSGLEGRRPDEVLLADVLNLLPIGVWITDNKGRIVLGNPAGREIWAGARYVGIDQYGEYKGWWVNSGERIKPREWAMARAVTQGETSLNEEIEIECFDGTHKIILNSALPIRNTGGEITGAIIINQDITRRREGERQLREQAAYTRSLIEASVDPLVTISPDGQITDVNKATEMATGVPREKLVGSDFSDSFTDPEKARAGYREVFLKGSVRDYPLAIRHVSGKVTHVLYNATVYRNEAGEVQGIFAAARDITERKAVEEERLRLAMAIDQVAEGVSIVDLEGRIMYANPAFAEHHGLPREGVAGWPLPDVLLIDARDRETLLSLRDAIRSGTAWNWHVTQRMPDGILREIDLSVSPRQDESGQLIGSIAVDRDVTQETKLEKRVRERQKMEALGTLAGGIAHDFNNVLLPILINTELMLNQETKDSPAARRLSQVLEAARRGKDMVRQIIAFSQQKEQERKPIAISPIINESMKFLRISLPKNIELHEKIEARSAMAVADPTQIHQVLVNLGSNAAHAMREKGGVLEIGLTTVSLDDKSASRFIGLKPGPYLCLTVRDTGHGMTPDVIERVFEPFFTTKKQGEGSGMGLAVVHGIVKGHGGAISLSSELGKGTEFAVYLPRVTGIRQAEKETTAPYPTGTERILFVDDEVMQVRAMSKLLEHLGYRAVGLTDPRQALEVFRRHPRAFDVLITDQTMPNMSGIELACEILKTRPDLPVIVCTGYSETLGEKEALAMGIKDFMMKPFSVREIAEAIRRVLPKKA